MDGDHNRSSNGNDSNRFIVHNGSSIASCTLIRKGGSTTWSNRNDSNRFNGYISGSTIAHASIEIGNSNHFDALNGGSTAQRHAIRNATRYATSEGSAFG